MGKDEETVTTQVHGSRVHGSRFETNHYIVSPKAETFLFVGILPTTKKSFSPCPPCLCGETKKRNNIYL